MVTIYQEHQNYVTERKELLFFNPPRTKHINVFDTNAKDITSFNTNNELIDYYDNQNSVFNKFNIKNTITYDQQKETTNKIDSNKNK